MSSDYKIISSDSHVIEPWFLWRDRLPKEYRDRAPRLIHGEDGDKLVCEDIEMPPIGTAAGVFRGNTEVRQPGRWEEDIPQRTEERRVGKGRVRSCEIGGVGVQ